MSIYRGAGGSGDATADSSSEALLVRELAIEVQADADAAAASASAATSSASAAATSATNAASSATSAASSASSASTSATNAASSATNAASSATDAETAQAAAETAQVAAETAQVAAETAETNAETAATNAASSASAASTSATNASNSATAASTSATNASNSASAAATSATNAASSATSASGSATAAASSASSASTSASNAATSETNAATSASTATTQAGLAATSASNAATSETNAATSETNAASSASAASTSASNAASSASAAGTSATNAAASAAAAAASYDSFDDRYLGVKTTAPTLDNDGNALVTGALYYNDGTVTAADKGMWVYDGSQWIAASAASTAILTVFKYTATAAQTTFTGADDNALTLTYTAGSAIITLNGAVLEVGTDVTATTGTSIVLAQAALAGDEVNIYAFATFNIANVYTQAEVDTALALKLNAANPSYTGTLTGGTGVVNLGSGQFYKDASGKVGIGTTTLTNALTVSRGSGVVAGLDLMSNANTTSTAFFVGQGSSNQGFLYNRANEGLYFGTNNTERMRIDSSGNVGIGTSSPTQPVELVKNQDASTWFSVSNNNSGTGAAAGYLMTNNTGVLGALQLNSSTNSTSGAGNAVVLRTLSTNPLVFGTNSTERMRIDSSGNVGIGTSSPNSPAGSTQTTLHISNANTATSPGIHLTNGDTGTSAGNGTLMFVGNAAGTGVTSFNIYNQQSSPICFFTGTTERMRIDTYGNTIIGGSTGLGASGGRLAVYGTSGGQNGFIQVTNPGYGTGTLGILGTSSNFKIYNSYSSGTLGTGAGIDIDTSGNLMVGTTSPTGVGFSVVPQTSIGAPYTRYNKSYATTVWASTFEHNGSQVGTITYSNTATAYNTSSDYRLKENIAPMTGALDVVAQLKPVTYNWKADGSSGQGFIAHELQAVVPDCVTGEKDAVDEEGKPVYQGIDTSFLVATLTKAIQEQQQMIEELKARIEVLETN